MVQAIIRRLVDIDHILLVVSAAVHSSSSSLYSLSPSPSAPFPLCSLLTFIMLCCVVVLCCVVL
jgi:hypothetical protein